MRHKNQDEKKFVDGSLKDDLFSKVKSNSMIYHSTFNF